MKKVCFIPWEGAPKKNYIFDNKNNWEHILKKMLAKDKIKICTDDILSIEDADACIFFDNLYYKNLKQIWDLYNNHKLHKTIYIDYEPPSGHCHNHSKKGLRKISNMFKYVITYNDDIIGNNIKKGNVADYYCEELPYKKDFKKRKLIALLNNNTSVDNIIGILNYYNSSDYYNKHNFKMLKNAIYYKRKEAAEFFLKKCPQKFDLYGTLWGDEFSSVLKGYAKKEDKYNVLSKYKFIISFDSIINQKGYISEKIFDCFKSKTVPIYLGADNVTQYIPKECFIDFRDYSSYEELYDYINNMKEKTYEKYISAIEKYLKSQEYKNLFSSEAIAQIIYDALNEKNDNFSYEKAYKALKYFDKKKEKVLKKRKINYYINEYNENKGYLQINFEINDYYYNKNAKYIVYLNEKEVIKNDYKEQNFENSVIKYSFNIQLNINKPKNVLKIKYLTPNGESWLNLFDYNEKYSKSLGLYNKKKGKSIIYYSPKYLHGYEKFKDKIKNNKIKIYFKGVTKNFSKLPSLYLKDIKHVFDKAPIIEK